MADQLALHDQCLGGQVDGLLVHVHQAPVIDVSGAEELRDHAPAARVAEDCALPRALRKRARRKIRDGDQLLADVDGFHRLLRRQLVWTHADRADHPGRDRCGAAQVTENTACVLAVKDVLARERAEEVTEVRRKLRTELEPFFLCREGLVVAADLSMRGGAAPDREPHVCMVRLEEVRSDRMPELVSSDCDPVPLGVLDWDGEPRLDVAHRLADVLPVEGVTSVFERVQQRERQHLLDIGGRVALGDACELFAPAWCVEDGVVLLLVEVKASDVLAVLAVGEAEDDLTPESSRPGQCLVEHRRPVGRADEKNVVVGRLERFDAQRNARAVECDHTRKEQAVQGEVDQGAGLPDDHARIVDAVHQDQQQAAPDLRPLAGGADHQVDAQRVDAEEHARKRTAGGDIDRHVQGRGDRFGQHRLACAGRSDHQHAALALAAGLHVEPARLDQLEDAAHLFDCGLLPPHVRHVHAEVGVVGVDHRLADARVDVEGQEEDRELGQDQEQDVEQVGEERLRQLGKKGKRVERRQPEDEVHGAEVQGGHDPDPQSPFPEDRAVRFDRSRQDVRFRSHAFAQDQPSPDDAQQPASDDHGEQRVDEGPADPQLQPDQGERESSASDEEREDPKDDHGGSLTIRGRVSTGPVCDRMASAMTTPIPSATTTSPGLYASGSNRPIPGKAIQSASQLRVVSAVINVY